MKPIVYTDINGFRRVKLLRDEDDENLPEIGIPAGPPDIMTLPWDEIQMTINNLLVDRQFWNMIQVRARQELFAKTIASAIYEHLMQRYKEGEHS